MSKLAPSTLIIALTCLPPYGALAADGQPSLPADSRMKVLMYNESDVYTITVKYGYQTNVVFAPGEEIHMISVGDRSMWQIVPNGNRLFLRAMMEDVSTNMTVITNQHSYQFDLKAVGEKSNDNVYVARFFYPEDAPPKPEAPANMDDLMRETGVMPSAPVETVPPPAPVEAAESAPVLMAQEPKVQPKPEPAVKPVVLSGKPAGKNFNYTYTGPDELAPSEVYDDGKTTYFKYRIMNQSMPNVYIIDRAGNEVPVAHYRKGEMMAVDAVAGKMTLKNSSGAVTIYNETLNPL